MNGLITNATLLSDVVFFNEAMIDMLSTRCKDMINKHGYTDAKILPDPIAHKTATLLDPTPTSPKTRHQNHYDKKITPKIH
ncbi:hypothetical protein M8C21_009269 [Ambrosia artemisiifolia]|uniref:Uncharacterized protein n=1 Tax=Ambrosia artemisiifolia TaxID=4212 RepID=A0AAD5CNJ2_AMBAR|nr:hypothetical protein M8C21_009269 [Ambrosia artemisiifolia]